jgi:hypothetical protein
MRVISESGIGRDQADRNCNLSSVAYLQELRVTDEGREI